MTPNEARVDVVNRLVLNCLAGAFVQSQYGFTFDFGGHRIRVTVQAESQKRKLKLRKS